MILMILMDALDRLAFSIVGSFIMNSDGLST